MYLLDTDTLSHLWAHHPLVKMRLQEIEETNIGTTAITKCEILRARCENLLKAEDSEQVLKAQQRLNRSEQLLAELVVIPFDESASKQLDKLSTLKFLKKIGRADLLIASIVMANDATLVTRNLKHFHTVPGLKVVNWVDG